MAASCDSTPAGAFWRLPVAALLAQLGSSEGSLGTAAAAQRAFFRRARELPWRAGTPQAHARRATAP